MADAAVGFLLGNLQQLLLYHSDLIKGAKTEVENLEKDLRIFSAFLEDCTKKRRKDKVLQELVRQIRDVVYEAEDIIDTFVTQAAIRNSVNYFLKAFKKPVHLHDIAVRVKPIRHEVDRVYGGKSMLDFAARNIADGDREETEAPLVKYDNIVGFEDEAEKIIGYLKEKTDQLDVISVIGMPGLGKTTLAWKIFHDKNIQYEFPIRAWVYVSQEFTKENVFLAILRGLSKLNEDMKQKNGQELAEIVRDELKTGKFLIVMDDVWSAHDWNEIQNVFPRDNSAGKVLITSRHREVACFANPQRAPHKLRFLTPEESWLLFQYEVFHEPKCPTELEVPAKVIVGECRGLPLAIVVIGGIVVKKFVASDDIDVKRKALDKVSKSVGEHITQEDTTQRMESIIALSYDKLPYHLRACFLYLGMFPEDTEIPVWRLIRMWIAEGFIQQKQNSVMSLEETAENYLDDLVNRNLVRADKRRPDGSVKTCRIHDMLRAFCINEARGEKENFLQEIKKQCPDGAVHKYRRICIHSNVSNFISPAILGTSAHVRSFVCFSKEDINLPPEKTSTIPAAFKLLRVLDVNPIKFGKIPNDMYQLLHLRYIALSFNLEVLPAPFAKLWNLETLIAETSSRTLDIRADIWKLNQLRHLKTNALATLTAKSGKSAKDGENLRTLGTISPESCTEEIIIKCRNLKKLGIRGNLVSFLGSFERLGKLRDLEKLKLLNDMFPLAASDNPLPCLPQPYQFPPKLKILTLSDTFLEWTHMSILGLLQNLEVLKLKDKAFMGATWEAEDGGFRRLEFLDIGRTDLSVWKATQNHYPRLKCLKLRNCEMLQGIPIGLADIPSFRLLDLHRSNLAAVSAKDIETKIKKLDAQNNKDSGFTLSIFPPPATAQA